MLRLKTHNYAVRLLALIMSVMFALSALTISAFAEEGAQDAGAPVSSEAAAVEEAPAASAETTEPAAEAAEEEEEDAAEAETASSGDDPILTNRLPDWPKAKAKKSDFVCLYDMSTGTVLLNKSMDVATPPASLTKIMTTLIAIENGNLDDQVAMTEAGLALAVAGSTNLYTVEGESFRLEDMLYGIMLASANDMAQQVAEYVGGGSVDNFVAMMNERAKELGCTGTVFVNATGMPEPGQVTTAHDMALICAAAMKQKPFRKIAKAVNYTIPATAIYAARELITQHPALAEPSSVSIPGVTGGKTGYSDDAGSCAATFAKRDGRNVICITLHADDLPTAMSDTKSAFNYAFKKWKLRELKLEENEELTDGGKILTPVKRTVSECEKQETVTDNGDGREKVETVYLWSGVPVGTSTVLRAPVAESEPEAAVSSGSAPAEAAAESGAASLAEPAAETPLAETSEAPAAEMTTETAEATAVQAAPTVQLPFGVTMNRTSFISIAVLALLILLGIILILLTIALRKR